MGYSHAENIRTAGAYLLRLLSEETTIEYTRFYDGTDDTRLALYASLGLTEEDGEYYCAEHLIDLAAAQLEAQGFIHTETLSSKLADGEPNYSIRLAADARGRFASGEEPKYWDAE